VTTKLQQESYGFSVAPMLDWTDRHCRLLHRQLTIHALLFTEMVTAPAILHGDPERLLGFNGVEHPVAVQLGGADPAELAAATRICADFGYDEINLNIGCPSDRVQSGRFGACLMAEPELVAQSVAAMKSATDLPVSVKCRIGIDDQDIEEPLDRFANAIIDAGADRLYVHARKGWLNGLSPKENRTIPPLDHDRVHRLAARIAPIPVIINGGIETLDQAVVHLEKVSGVMLGRAAYHNPMLLAEVDSRIFGQRVSAPTIAGVTDAMIEYAHTQMAQGVRLNSITRHMIGLAHGLPGARRFRQILTMDVLKEGAGPETIARALAELDL
jgi:tRNA-dihydrouridine synthase A